MKRVILFLVTLFIASPAYAQYGVPGADGAVSIAISPQYPAPGQNVTLTLSSGLYDLDASTIVWRAGGVPIAQGVGARSAQIVAGSLGQPTDITVSLTSDAGSASTELTIIPTTVNMLWESTSYTPPFYRGRALPSAGAAVTVVAIPQFGSQNTVAANSLVYTWKQDGQILSALSGRGKSSITVPGPMLYGSTAITVDVSATNGSIAGEGVLRIGDQSSDLAVYQDHPLYGILYNRALGTNSFFSDTESAFTAVPYFAPSDSEGSDLSYTWTVNRSQIANDPKHPSEITINAANSNGIALLGVALSSATNDFYSIDGQWSVTLGANAGGAANIPSNPFSAIH